MPKREFEYFKRGVELGRCLRRMHNARDRAIMDPRPGARRYWRRQSRVEAGRAERLWAAAPK